MIARGPRKCKIINQTETQSVAEGIELEMGIVYCAEQTEMANQSFWVSTEGLKRIEKDVEPNLLITTEKGSTDTVSNHLLFLWLVQKQ